VSARGLTTSEISYNGRGFEIEFDFIDHKLVLATTDGLIKDLALVPISVAQFYRDFMALLGAADIKVKIWKMPVEVPDPIPFDQDNTHAAYDPEYAHRFWQVLLSSSQVLYDFRAGFIGKNSPVHFFWGSFDLAVSRFSGRRAPPRPGADSITLEAYSHEVSSLGFWPGGKTHAAAFYSYMAPQPAGFGDSQVRPDAAFYEKELGEFVLPYDAVRQSRSPEKDLLEFCQTTYEAGATLANWDRGALERVQERR